MGSNLVKSYTLQKKQLKRCITRTRRNLDKKYENYGLPGKLKKTLNKRKFFVICLYNNNILIFGTERNLIHLKYSENWAVMALFSAAKIIRLIVHYTGLIRGKFYPLCFCLMKIWTCENYDNVFNFLKNKCVIEPANIVVTLNFPRFHP